MFPRPSLAWDDVRLSICKPPPSSKALYVKSSKSSSLIDYWLIALFGTTLLFEELVRGWCKRSWFVIESVRIEFRRLSYRVVLRFFMQYTYAITPPMIRKMHRREKTSIEVILSLVQIVKSEHSPLLQQVFWHSLSRLHVALRGFKISSPSGLGRYLICKNSYKLIIIIRSSWLGWT